MGESWEKSWEKMNNKDMAEQYILAEDFISWIEKNYPNAYDEYVRDRDVKQKLQ